ncbi:hypothetical protein CA13_25400 [Planctomycetes bacterium CA13]|uniref:Zinc-ribbon domain-containing protein n=1 Tax=Novipirellula herctigrandis TaxID=2527986 RepID=A0A5C5Z3G1_9BACT|nr:hypothetical protein CA13_25400 [Planctomycetes bacterium CA13]
MSKSHHKPDFSCPHCGGDVPGRAKACPHCGSSDADGWRDSTEGFGEEDLDDAFDYDDYIANEFGDKHVISRKLKPWQIIVTVLILLSFVLLLF